MEQNNSNGRNLTSGSPQAPTAPVSPTQRPVTPSDSLAGARDPFGDSRAESQASQRPGPTTNPFVSPDQSRPGSGYASSRSLGTRFEEQSQRYFHSRRVRKGDVEKPWMAKKDPKEKWVTIIPLLGILLGLIVSGFLIWDGIRGVVKHNYELVLSDDFSQGIRSEVWTREIQVGGFGNGEFEETTASEDNIFVENGNLRIQATLQDENKITKDTIIDLTKAGTCTSKLYHDCVAATNTTAGNSTIVPPTRSGRLTTKKSASIRYGKIEVTAKLPVGDWLWPAIWMMPVKDTYGDWPASGEIDIMESRGNDHEYAQGGNNIISSALHWGPSPSIDAWWRTYNKRRALHQTYGDGFNVYGLEWSQKYLFTYVNSRLLQVLYTNFDKPLWQRGNFPAYNSNGTRVQDVWSQTGRAQTPFDQPFYLILNVAVGGTNGWFEDAKSDKPWSDTSPNAKIDFWRKRDQWFPTWTQPYMEISKVEMWQQNDGNEEL